MAADRGGACAAVRYGAAALSVVLVLVGIEHAEPRIHVNVEFYVFTTFFLKAPLQKMVRVAQPCAPPAQLASACSPTRIGVPTPLPCGRAHGFLGVHIIYNNIII